MMTDDELSNILDREIESSVGGRTSDLTQQWRESIDDYHGKRKPAPAGGAQIVSTDVADAIEWLLPEVIRVFTDERVCRVTAHGPDQEVDALQDALNHIFYDAEPGRSLPFLYTWIKDALLQKNGIAKIWWNEETTITRETYEDMSEEQFMMLMQDPEIKISQTDEDGQEIEVSEDAGEEMPLYITVERRKTKEFLDYSSIPPEEFLVSSEQTTLDLKDVRFCGHYRRMMSGELIEMGVPADIVDELPEADWTSDRDTEVNYSRDTNNTRYFPGSMQADSGDDSTKYREVYELYPLIDYDGDGIPERRRILKSGNHILQNDPWSARPPFAALTPFIESHMFYGLSIWDKLKDVQAMRTSLWRQFIDNNNLINNPRDEVVMGKVMMDDLKTRKPGQFVRVREKGSVTPLPIQPFGAETLQAMQVTDQLIQRRSGVLPGDSSESMMPSNTTAHGMERMMSAKEELQWLITKVFAETGVRVLFQIIYDTVREFGSEFPLSINDEWQQVDPSQWPEDIVINVVAGAGMGTRMRHAASLREVIGHQMSIKQMGGEGILVNDSGIFSALEDWAKAVGLSAGRSYFLDPDGKEAQATKQGRMEGQQRAEQAQQQVAQQQQENQNRLVEIEEAKTRLDALKAQSKTSFDYDKMMAELKEKFTELELKYTELELKYKTNVPGSRV